MSIVIPCYNQAHFLGEAVESVLAQSVCAQRASREVPIEVIVVDDGSTDHTPEVVSRYEGVRYLRQRNGGLAAARNAGLAASRGAFVVFLDADDRLLPGAVEAGLAAFEAHPESALVYGTYRHIRADGTVSEDGWKVNRVYENHYEHMLRRNFIVMHAAVMYRRTVLDALEGFDASLAACEDWDLYLRLMRHHAVYCYQHPAAEYRLHDTSMSTNSARMLETSLHVLRRQRPFIHGERREKAYRKGINFCINYYGDGVVKHFNQLLRNRQFAQAAKQGTLLMKHAPLQTADRAARHMRRTGVKALKRVLPTRVRNWGAAIKPGPRSSPPIGKVRMGDLRRLVPLDRPFGFGRGLPVDRHYIERHLAHHAQDVRGRVMEIKDGAYTQRFGGDRVTQSEVWDVDASNPAATIVADLADAPEVSDASFDCIILSQTLHLIYDFRAALATTYRTLKPGGVLLASVPGITKVPQDIPWHWSFTEACVRKLMAEFFAPEDVEVQAHGNVLVAQAFLQGIAAGELEPHELNHYDPEYPVVVTIRAKKQAHTP